MFYQQLYYMQYAPTKLDPTDFKFSVKCSLAHDEYISELRMVSNSSSDYQQIKAMRWKTNKGNFCVVPSKYQPNDGVFQHGVTVEVGSGIPYGMALSEIPQSEVGMSPSKVSSMGIIFYDIVTGINNDIQWSVDKARQSLHTNPTFVSTSRCNSTENVNGRCRVRFSYTKANAQSIQRMLLLLL